MLFNNKIRYVFAALFCAFGLPASASSFNWQGPYLGGYLGEASGNNHVSTNAGTVTDTSYFTTSADINAVNNAGSWTKNPNATIVGIQLGHDWAWKQIVYGLALDYSNLPLSSSMTTNNTYPDNTDQYSVATSMQTDWLFNMRARLGYQTMVHFPALFYFTGGLALTQLEVSNHFTDNSAFAGLGSSHNSQNQIAWISGAGIEVVPFKHVSVNFEYLYFSAPSIKTMSTIGNTEGGFGIPTQSLTSVLSTTANFHASLFKIGLNYRFDE